MSSARPRSRGSWRRWLNLVVALGSAGGLAWLVAARYGQLGTAIAGGSAREDLVSAVPDHDADPYPTPDRHDQS